MKYFDDFILKFQKKFNLTPQSMKNVLFLLCCLFSFVGIFLLIKGFNFIVSIPILVVAIILFTRASSYGLFINTNNEIKSNNIGYSNPKNKSYIAQYVLSLLIPLVGIISGAIFLTHDKEKEKSTGIKCILLSICSCIIDSVIVYVILCEQ